MFFSKRKLFAQVQLVTISLHMIIIMFIPTDPRGMQKAIGRQAVHDMDQ
jgi:hypothetical protein